MKITRKRFTNQKGAITYYQIELDKQIDLIRARYLAPGVFILEEYLLAYEEAIQFQKDEYKEPAPSTVSSLAEVLNISNQAATEKLLQIKEDFYEMMAVTRHARLLGKATIAKATTAMEAREAYRTTILSLAQLPVPQPL